MSAKSKKKSTSTSEFHLTDLMNACQNNNVDEVKSLIRNGANIDEVDSNKRSAIFYCMENKDIDCLKLLINAKADVNLQDKDGYSCLHLAVISGNLLVVESLMKANASLDVFDSELHSLIHWCVVCGHYEILDYLLNNKCNAETADTHGAYPIHYAAQMCGQIDLWDENISRNPEKSLIILKRLIGHKVKIEVEDNDNRNPLIWASSSGSEEAILALFSAGANPVKHEKDGLTPLHCAASRGHLKCVKMLLEKCKVPIDIKDNNNCTSLFYSVTLGQYEVTEYLIKHGADLTLQDSKGRTVYHCAAAKGQAQCLELLCKYNSTIWKPNNRGDFPIHEAYYNRNMECVNFMVNVLNELNVIQSSNSIDGRTLLHLAAAENDDEFCEQLLKNGAYVNSLMRTSSGVYLTPLDVAKLRSKNCFEIIQSYGGTTGTKVAGKAATRIQRNLKRFIVKKLDHYSTEKPNRTRSKIDIETNTSNSNNKEKEKLIINDTINKKIFCDKSAQTTIRSTTQKIIVLTPLPSDQTTSEAARNTNKILSRSSSTTGELSVTSSSDIHKKHKNRHEKSTHHSIKHESNDKLPKTANLKPLKTIPKLKKRIESTEKLYSSQATPRNQSKRYPNEKHLVELKGNNKKEQLTRYSSKVRNHHKNDESFLTSNTSSASSSSSELFLDHNDAENLNFNDNTDSHHHHCHYHCHHFHHHHAYSRNDSDFENFDSKPKSKPKIFDTDVEKKKVKLKETQKNNNNKSTSKLGLIRSNTILDYKLNENGDNPKKLNDVIDNNTVNESHLVKLIIKSESVDQNPYNNNNNQNNNNSYQNLFERQRLLLKSLYEIRRSRINNRNIIINADLNNLLIKNYNFDIQKNCKSLKDLEKLLEILAMEISDEFKKFNKRSKTTLKMNKSNTNTSSIMALSNGAINTSRTTDYQIPQNKQLAKTKSFQISKNNSSEDHLNEQQQIKLLEAEYLKQKRQQQNLQLKVAYKPLLPDDIYKQYYDKNSKPVTLKQPSPRDKTIFLPVIRPK